MVGKLNAIYVCLFLSAFSFAFNASAIGAAPDINFIPIEIDVTDSGTGLPVTVSGTINVVAKVYNKTGACVLFQESQAGALTGITNGLVSMKLGVGILGTNSNTLTDAMSNSAVARNCVPSGSYTPGATDGRTLELIFSGAFTSTVSFQLGQAPFAMSALVAGDSSKLSGKSASDFVYLNTSTYTNMTQTNFESLFNRYTKLDSILNNFDSGGGTFTGAITGNVTGNVSGTAANVTGTVALANGGTGATTATAARTNLGLGTLAVLSPTGTASSSTYLRGDGTWATVAGGGVTSVSSANSDIAVATGTTTPVLTLNSGTSANQILKLDAASKIPAVDGSQLTNLTPANFNSVVPVAKGGTGASTASGALTSLLPAQSGNAGKFLTTDGSITSWASAGTGTVTNVSGTSPISVATGTSTPVIKLTDGTSAGQTLRWNGTSWVSGFVSMTDLRSTITGSITFSAGCTSNQTLTWTSASDNLTCTNISLPASQISGVIGAMSGGTGYNSFTIGDILYASSASALGKLSAGSSGQVLTSNGAGVAPSWQTISANDSTKLPLAGGTMTGALIISGADAKINGLTVGLGNGSISTNTAFGASALNAMTGNGNTGIGAYTLYNNTSGANNVGVGSNALVGNATGSNNVAVGKDTLYGLGTNDSNVAVGFAAGTSAAGSSYNVYVGRESGKGITVGAYNTLVGSLSGFSLSSNDSNNTIIGSISGTAGLNNTVIIGAGTNERLRIDSSGNLGLGTTAPSSAIDVRRNNNAIFQTIGYGPSSSAADQGFVYVGKARGTASAPSVVSSGDEIGTIGFLGYYGTDYTQGASIVAKTTEAWSGSVHGTQLTFSTTTNGSASPTAKMVITNSGNVGIGSTSPSAKLEVAGDLKLGISGSSCTASLTGAIRYNAQVEYCNGTGWVPVGAPSGTHCGVKKYCVSASLYTDAICNGNVATSAISAPPVQCNGTNITATVTKSQDSNSAWYPTVSAINCPAGYSGDFTFNSYTNSVTVIITCIKN